MSSPNFVNNALTQLFDDIEQKCHVKFNSFTANDKPQKKGLNADQEYMKMYEESEDHRTYKYLYDPDLNFDYRFHQRMARINFGKRKEPWCSLMFNTNYVKPVTNVLSHVYDGIEYAKFQQKKADGTTGIVTEGVEYQFRRALVPVNFVLLSNELSYLYHIMENLAMYFDRWVDFTYKQKLQFSPLTEVHWDLVGHAQNIRQVNLDKLDTESKGSLAMVAYSFELIYWNIWSTDARYGLLERIIVEVHEARTNQVIFIDICD